MTSLASVMDSSLSAMFAAQLGLATTSHNIANADRPGYSRQLNVQAARRPLNLPLGAIGTGVDVVTVRRAQDRFLLANLRTQTSRLGSYGAVDSALVELESILGSVDNDHLGNALTGFFTAWSDLSTSPQIQSLQESVYSAAEALVADFHNVNDSLDELARNIDTQIGQEIETLNDLLGQVGELNGQIMSAEVGGQTANDLRDQRDALLTEVAAIADVSVHERDDGSLDVILNGRTIVTRQTVQRFTTEYERGDSGYVLTVVTEDNVRTVQLASGRLQGLLDARDVHVDATRERLNEVVAQLVHSVNELHMQGRTGEGAGLPFFVGDSLPTIEVNEAIRNDHTLIATSRSGQPGDGDIAREIADLANAGLPGEERTVGDLYRGTLIDLAAKRSSYEFMVESQDSAVAAVEARIASVSGVSIDEEGAAMLRYQNTYSAAARVITTVQEMFEALLNMI